MGAVVALACGAAVRVGAVRHDLAVVGPVVLSARRAALRLLEEAVARVEARVAHADDLVLAVQAHVPDRRRVDCTAVANTVESVRARLRRGHALDIERLELLVRLDPHHLGLVRQRLGYRQRVLQRHRHHYRQPLRVRLHRHHLARRQIAARPRAPRGGAALAQRARQPTRQLGAHRPEMLVPLVGGEAHVERHRAVGGSGRQQRVEVGRHLELGQQRHDLAHLGLTAQRVGVLARAVHEQVIVHHAVDGHWHTVSVRVRVRVRWLQPRRAVKRCRRGAWVWVRGGGHPWRAPRATRAGQPRDGYPAGGSP